MKKFLLLEDRFDHKAGETVFLYTGHDYGCARDDSISTREPHISVSSDGQLPFFTAPTRILKEQE